MGPKSPDAFRTISEVAALVGVEQHVLRFWETKFPAIKPVKRAGGRRYYRKGDVDLLGGIRLLLKDDMVSIKGVQRVLAEKGAAHVAALPSARGLAPDGAPRAAADDDAAGDPVAAEAAEADAPSAAPRVPEDRAPMEAEVDATPAEAAEGAGAEDRPAPAPRPMPDLPGDLDLPPAPAAPSLGGSAGRAALVAWLAEARALHARLGA